MSAQIEDRYIGTFVLHAIGDTIGFRNGSWEFYGDKMSTFGIALEKLYEFIDLGGINDINLQNWRVSDDTILHMAVGKALLVNHKSPDELNKVTTRLFRDARLQMMNDETKKKPRYIGMSTFKYLTKIENGDDWASFGYDSKSTGNGAAMRSHCIGLAFFGTDKRTTLINYAIDSSSMSHPNPIGILGGVSVALFTAFAIEGIPLYKWPVKMLEIIESDAISKRMNNPQAYMNFLDAWKSYLEVRFVGDMPLKTRSHINLIFRGAMYNTTLGGKYGGGGLGSNGHDAVIIAYDCLVDAESNWEKLVIYSMLNAFDTDTIGAIAGGLYGALYGTNGVPKNNMRYLEYRDELHDIGRGIYKKFYLNENIS